MSDNEDGEMLVQYVLRQLAMTKEKEKEMKERTERILRASHIAFRRVEVIGVHVHIYFHGRSAADRAARLFNPLFKVHIWETVHTDMPKNARGKYPTEWKIGLSPKN